MSRWYLRSVIACSGLTASQRDLQSDNPGSQRDMTATRMDTNNADNSNPAHPYLHMLISVIETGSLPPD